MLFFCNMMCCVPYVNIYDHDVSRARAGRVIVVSGSESKPKATDEIGLNTDPYLGDLGL